MGWWSKPVSFLVAAGSRRGTSVVFLKYRFFPFKVRLDTDAGHSLFDQLNVRTHDYWSAGVHETVVIESAEEWFRTDFTPVQPRYRKF